LFGQIDKLELGYAFKKSRIYSASLRQAISHNVALEVDAVKHLFVGMRTFARINSAVLVDDTIIATTEADQRRSW
jgi:hypothetical protein